MRSMLVILILGDEKADYLKDILLKLLLNEIYVGNFDYWLPTRKSNK